MQRQAIRARVNRFDPRSHFLVFVHIPKVGGTSLHSWLKDAMGGKYSLLHAGKLEKGIFKEQLVGVGGHQRFGENPIASKSDKQLVNVTIVREPFERFVSFFNHVASHPEHHLHAKFLKVHKDFFLFAESIYRQQNREISNLQTKMLGGGEQYPDWKVAVETLAENFSVVGIFEDMPGFYAELRKLVGGGPISDKKLNVSKSKNFSATYLEKNKKAMDFVYDINREDLLLYSYLRFQKKIRR